MKNNEQGISLVELLAALTLLAIVGLLIWSVFFQGYRFSRESITISQLQQEANRISTELQNFHRNAKSAYTLDSRSCKIFIQQNGEEKIELRSRMCLAITDIENRSTMTIDPDRENKKIVLRVADKNYAENQVEIEIFLNRLKKGD